MRILPPAEMFSTAIAEQNRPVRPCRLAGRTRDADAGTRCFGLGCGDAMATTQGEPTGDDTRMRRSYLRVILVWVITLAALYAFQEYFT
jgi:hypothetical protein